MKNLLNSFLLILGSLIISSWVIDNLESHPVEIVKGNVIIETPECVQVYYAIEKYSKKYDIPKKYVYGVAYYETRYRGPFHWEYNSKQTSPTGALGPMQVLHSTALYMFPDSSFSRDYLRDDIDFNIKCSVKYIRYLYDKLKSWDIVFGYYNTGYPEVNDYALQVINYHEEYRYQK